MSGDFQPHKRLWRRRSTVLPFRPAVTLLAVLFSYVPFGQGWVRAQTVHQRYLPVPANVLLARGRTEPTVAVDPAHPKFVIASANTNYGAPVAGTYPTAYFASHDGGASFVTGTSPVSPPYTTEADTTVAVARDGTVFYSYLGESPAFCSNGGAGILLTHSTDHGGSYKTPTIVDSNPLDDKPNMAVQSLPGRQSHVFITWTRWHEKSSDIWYARSLDGGRTFSRPAELWSSTLDNFGSVPVVGPGGRVYVFWATYPDAGNEHPVTTEMFVRVSADDGGHFGGRSSITPAFQSVPRMARPAMLRILTMPSVAIDSDGTIYAGWSVATRRYTNGRSDADIVVTRSIDGARTWSRPQRVNDVRAGERFMPALAILQRGVIGVAFYDQRRGPYGLDVYATRVHFGTRIRASANVRVNARASSVADIIYIAPNSTCFSPGRFFGDYIGVAARRGALCVVWADTQLHVADETDVWFARVAL